MIDEMFTLYTSSPWELVPLLLSKFTIGFHWVDRVKVEEIGTMGCSLVAFL